MDAEAPVTKGDLARVLVQALQREDEVENPENPQSWVDALAAMGISLSAASEALGSVDALPEIVASDFAFTSTDPLMAGVRAHSEPIHEQLESPVPVETVKKVLSRAESSDRKKVKPINPTPY